MKQFLKEFKANDYELVILNYFANNFLSKYDLEHYFIVAPLIVEEIEKDINKELIYDYIYDNLITYCVDSILCGDYKSAYERYNAAINTLEIAYIYQGQKLIKNKK